ncbi:hypothetical protein [Rubripirellula reticaptiva]|uniref:LTXXQ motif protein n=1 Tax=Rubripirellula reticaptiva TaxID=2528013 RepID=A0A5C6EHW1_9BACT|nr:hypothetical protein [Rubripirellula reticaptiva]TWU49373.1 hypothetical protein Poly59_39880 [Rubripirellula reticaptiva]
MKLSSSTFRLVAVILVSASMTVASAFAQDDGGRGRGGRGGPGGGGFGGGRGGPGGGTMGGDPTLSLLRVEAVRTELEVSPEQEEAITKLAEQMRPTRPEGVNFGEMSEEDRTAFFEKMRKEMESKSAEAKEKLEEVLFPEQLDRLKEISLQVQGSQALGNTEVAKELGISAEQKSKLEEVRETLRSEMQTKMREAMSNRDAGGGTGMREMFTKIQEEMDEKVFAVLTADQKAEFEKMKGKKFDMPEGAMGGGRGGPGGNRGGAGGPGGPGGRTGNRGGGRPQRPATAE